MLIGSIMESYEKGRWQELAARCEAAGCDALELNFSCPHGHPEKGMGAAMGQDPDRVETVTRWVVEAVNIPVWSKMTPNITAIVEPARALPLLSPSDWRNVDAYAQCFDVPRAACKTANDRPPLHGGHRQPQRAAQVPPYPRRRSQGNPSFVRSVMRSRSY